MKMARYLVYLCFLQPLHLSTSVRYIHIKIEIFHVSMFIYMSVYVCVIVKPNAIRALRSVLHVYCVRPPSTHLVMYSLFSKWSLSSSMG